MTAAALAKQAATLGPSQVAPTPAGPTQSRQQAGIGAPVQHRRRSRLLAQRYIPTQSVMQRFSPSRIVLRRSPGSRRGRQHSPRRLHTVSRPARNSDQRKQDCWSTPTDPSRRFCRAPGGTRYCRWNRCAPGTAAPRYSSAAGAFPQIPPHRAFGEVLLIERRAAPFAVIIRDRVRHGATTRSTCIPAPRHAVSCPPCGDTTQPAPTSNADTSTPQQGHTAVPCG